MRERFGEKKMSKQEQFHEEKTKQKAVSREEDNLFLKTAYQLYHSGGPLFFFFKEKVFQGGGGGKVEPSG